MFPKHLHLTPPESEAITLSRPQLSSRDKPHKGLIHCCMPGTCQGSYALERCPLVPAGHFRSLSSLALLASSPGWSAISSKSWLISWGLCGAAAPLLTFWDGADIYVSRLPQDCLAGWEARGWYTCQRQPCGPECHCHPASGKTVRRQSRIDTPCGRQNTPRPTKAVHVLFPGT